MIKNLVKNKSKSKVTSKNKITRFFFIGSRLLTLCSFLLALFSWLFSLGSQLLFLFTRIFSLDSRLFSPYSWLLSLDSFLLTLDSRLSTLNPRLSTLNAFHFLLFTWFFSLGSSSVQAQDTIKKPKIGLVLSGGGAKGLAHIGVLKVIDSLGIKIDYIGGTSMGAIVGGLYATGYTANQLETIFNKLDTDVIIQDIVPRKQKFWANKENEDKYALVLPFKNFKLEAPAALSKGIYNFNFISQSTYHVRNIRDFSKLPIPFFCMATNIETGESVVLNKGILAQAVVASGTIPTLYNPIEIDNNLLVDGGVVNNYPVEELKKLGMDIIIGVDVQEPLKTRNDLQALTNILGQINNFNTQKDMIAKIEQTNVYIKPDIKGYGIMSFDEGKNIIENGKKAALKKLKDLEKLKTNNYQKPTIPMPSDSLFIGNIGFTNLKKQTRAYVMGKLQVKQNSKISFKDFFKGIINLNSTQNYSSVKYQFNDKDIFLNLRENKIKTYLKFGLHYDGLYKSSALINLTQNKLISKTDNFSLDFIAGDNVRYHLNYIIDNGFYWSFVFQSTLDNFNKNTSTAFNTENKFFQYGLERATLNYSSFTNKLFTQTVFLRKYQIGGGFEHQNLKLYSENLPKNDDVFDQSDYYSVFAFLNHDTFNSKFFPSKGWYFFGKANHYFNSSDFNKNFEPFTIAKADMGFAFSFFKKWRMVIQNEGGFKIGKSNNASFDFVLGGFGFKETNNIRPFYGYNFLDLSGNSYVKATATLGYEIFKKNHINLSYNAGIIDNFIFDATKTWFTKPAINGFALGYGLDTLIGPVEIKYSWSPEIHTNLLWFNVGFIF
jgi:NTE family protein